MRKLISLAAVTLAVPLVLGAQSAAAKAPGMIDPGMSRSQVVAVLGEPFSSRSRSSFTYLLYKNGCQKTCGMDDLVVLDSDKVVDAVFRSTDRHYSGTSSSPHMISADAAAKKGGDTSNAKPAPKRKVAAAKANDVSTPSVPVQRPKAKLAPAPTAKPGASALKTATVAAPKSAAVASPKSATSASKPAPKTDSSAKTKAPPSNTAKKPGD